MHRRTCLPSSSYQGHIPCVVAYKPQRTKFSSKFFRLLCTADVITQHSFCIKLQWTGGLSSSFSSALFVPQITPIDGQNRASAFSIKLISSQYCSYAKKLSHLLSSFLLLYPREHEDKTSINNHCLWYLHVRRLGKVPQKTSHQSAGKMHLHPCGIWVQWCATGRRESSQCPTNCLKQGPIMTALKTTCVMTPRFLSRLLSSTRWPVPSYKNSI